MVHHLRIFERALYLTLLQLMDYCERQLSRLVHVCGLQKLMQKLELRLNLEMVDVCSHFGINCSIRAYGDSISAQFFFNCASNTIP